MRKKRLFTRILIPTLVTLLLLPPLTCLIFFCSARQYAYNEAVENLADFQRSVYPLIEQTRSDTIKRGGKDDDSELSAQEKSFLFRVSTLASSMGGYSQAMIFNNGMHVIFPRDEQLQEEITPLAEEFAAYILKADIKPDSKAMEFKTDSGEDFLVSIYKIQDKSTHIKYIIAYCPMYRIGSWVKDASLMVLLISFISVGSVIVSLWVISLGTVKPLRILCRGAERVGSSNFSKIKTEFPVIELDELRCAMNRMSEQLMQSDEIQKNFFQNVSHELRNPLMSISGYAQGIEQGVFDPPDKAAHTILEESMRLTDVVNSLLTLSRLEGDRQDTALEPARIADVVEDCIDRVNGLALQKGIKLSFDPPKGNISALGNEDMIGQVLDNLLTNAIRYAKSTVIISVLQRRQLVLLTVSDDGNGIALKDMPHIFERCYKGSGGNFGIGLAIARSAALKMQGELTAENQDNGGALFTLRLKAV